jgi:hypothetical protein
MQRPNLQSIVLVSVYCPTALYGLQGSVREAVGRACALAELGAHEHAHVCNTG